jgi:hypothetical protein
VCTNIRFHIVAQLQHLISHLRSQSQLQFLLTRGSDVK